jgi:hypothetical protein
MTDVTTDAPTTFLVELTPPSGGWSQLQELGERSRRAAAELHRGGVEVRFVRSIFVPERETCFVLYEAGSVEAVMAATSRAGLGFAAVTQALRKQAG